MCDWWLFKHACHTQPLNRARNMWSLWNFLYFYILCMQVVKALAKSPLHMMIQLNWCAGWSASFLFEYGIHRFCHEAAEELMFFTPSAMSIWASPWEKGTYHIGKQRRLRQAYAPMQSCHSLCCSYTTSAAKQQKPTKWHAPSEDSDQPGHPPSLIRVSAVHMKKAWFLRYLLSAQGRLWSDWADAKADLSLHWAHGRYCWICPAAAHIRT